MAAGQNGHRLTRLIWVPGHFQTRSSEADEKELAYDLSDG